MLKCIIFHSHSHLYVDMLTCFSCIVYLLPQRSFRRTLELIRAHHSAGFRTPFTFSSQRQRQPPCAQPEAHPDSELLPCAHHNVERRASGISRVGLRRMLQRMESSQFTRTLSRMAAADDAAAAAATASRDSPCPHEVRVCSGRSHVSGSTVVRVKASDLLPPGNDSSVGSLTSLLGNSD